MGKVLLLDEHVARRLRRGRRDGSFAVLDARRRDAPAGERARARGVRLPVRAPALRGDGGLLDGGRRVATTSRRSRRSSPKRTSRRRGSSSPTRSTSVPDGRPARAQCGRAWRSRAPQARDRGAHSASAARGLAALALRPDRRVPAVRRAGGRRRRASRSSRPGRDRTEAAAVRAAHVRLGRRLPRAMSACAESGRCDERRASSPAAIGRAWTGAPRAIPTPRTPRDPRPACA